MSAQLEVLTEAHSALGNSGAKHNREQDTLLTTWPLYNPLPATFTISTHTIVYLLLYSK